MLQMLVGDAAVVDHGEGSQVLQASIHSAVQVGRSTLDEKSQKQRASGCSNVWCPSKDDPLVDGQGGSACVGAANVRT